MKKILYILVAGAMLMTACKSKKDYTSWENIYDTPTATTSTTTPVTVTPVTQNQGGTTIAATNARVQTEDVTITHGSADKYCVIVGSFGDVNNATRLMENLKNDGYAGSCVMKNANNMNRVCCASFATETEARQKLAEVRNQYSDAWLLIRK